MHRLAWILLPCLLSACGSVMLPPSARLDSPRDVWRGPQPPGEAAETRVYALDDLPVQAAELQRLLCVLLPDSAAVSFHEAIPGELQVLTTPSLHAAVGELLETYRDLAPATLGLTVRIIEIPWSVAGSLGPYQLVSPAGASPMHSVPLSKAAVDWLWSLNHEGVERRARGGSLACQAGRWQVSENRLECAYLEQVDYPWRQRRRIADPVVAVAHDAVKLSALVLPQPDSSHWLLAYELEDRLLAGIDELRTQSFGGATDVTLSLPLWVDRQARGAVILEEGEALGLLAAGSQGMARLVVVLPVRGPELSGAYAALR